MKRNIPRIDNIRIATREKFPIFHELFFFVMLASARHRHLSWKGAMNSVHKIPSHFFEIHLISPSNLRLDFPSGNFTSAFPKKIVTWKQQQTIHEYIMDSSTFTGTKMLLLRFFIEVYFWTEWVKLRIYVVLCFIIFLRIIFTNSAPSSR